MTDTELLEGLATLLRGYTTAAPLSTASIFVWDQVAYKRGETRVTCWVNGGREQFMAIGGQADNWVDVNIRGEIPFADTQVNYQSIMSLCSQLRYGLRLNRALSAGGTTAYLNTDCTWQLGYSGEGQEIKRTCEVKISYRIPQTTAA